MVLGEGFPHFRERLIEQLQIEQLLGRIQTIVNSDGSVFVKIFRTLSSGSYVPGAGALSYVKQEVIAEAWGQSNIEALTNLASVLMKLGHKRFEE